MFSYLFLRGPTTVGNILCYQHALYFRGEPTSRTVVKDNMTAGEFTRVSDAITSIIGPGICLEWWQDPKGPTCLDPSEFNWQVLSFVPTILLFPTKEKAMLAKMVIS